MRFLRIMSIFTAWMLLVLVAATGQTLKTIHNFNGTDGEGPLSALVQGRDGRLYGTTTGGGTNFVGTIFKERTGGAVVTLHDFDGADGASPGSGPTLARDGNFYGTAVGGGDFDQGVLYRITPAGVFTVLHSFSSSLDGGIPAAPPIEASDGNLYGTTIGAIYRFTESGNFSILYFFDHSTGLPPAAPLFQGSDGMLYLVRYDGGTFNGGSVSRVTLSGSLDKTYDFTADSLGWSPVGPVIEASDGNFYGTTLEGGANGAGTVYRITPDWSLTAIYSFGAAVNDGKHPESGLTQGTDGCLYGTTETGGLSDRGTIFKITLDGSYTQLYSFVSPFGRGQPGAPVQDTSGNFYGVTLGGTYGLGSVYRLDMGLGAFVKFVRAQGKPGAKAQILGQGLTGTTSVMFNGVPAASFNVVRDTYMTAVVPDGATTGPVAVSTPTGTLTSNVSFRITN